MLDPRSTDTIIFFLLQNLKVKEINLSRNFKENIPNIFSLSDFEKYLTTDSDYKIYIDYKSNLLEITLKSYKPDIRYSSSFFCVFPSIFNSRYIFSLDNDIYKYSINFFNPFNFRNRLKKFLFKIYVLMKIKKVNLKINYNENDKFINDLLKTHLYSGVFDGKRTIVAMIFKNSIFKGYEKICIKSKGFEKMLNEYKFSKLFKKKVDNHFIIIPDVDLGNKVFPSLLISSSQIRSPFSIHRDLNKIFIFLKSIQSECYLTKVRKIIDFESVDPEFIVVLKKLENFEILISNVHGDLSPWNYFITDDSKLFIFDFENSQGNLPISYDFIKLSSEFVSFDDKDFQNFCENLIERYFNFCGLNFKPSDITKYLAISLIFYHNLNNRPNNNNFIDESIKIKSIINTVSNCENINVPAIE